MTRTKELEIKVWFECRCCQCWTLSSSHSPPFPSCKLPHSLLPPLSTLSSILCCLISTTLLVFCSPNDHLKTLIRSSSPFLPSPLHPPHHPPTTSLPSSHSPLSTIFPASSSPSPHFDCFLLKQLSHLMMNLIHSSSWLLLPHLHWLSTSPSEPLPFCPSLSLNCPS